MSAGKRMATGLSPSTSRQACTWLGAAGGSPQQFWFWAFWPDYKMAPGQSLSPVGGLSPLHSPPASVVLCICHSPPLPNLFTKASGVTSHHCHRDCNHRFQQVFSQSGSGSRQRHSQLPPSSSFKFYFLFS